MPLGLALDGYWCSWSYAPFLMSFILFLGVFLGWESDLVFEIQTLKNIKISVKFLSIPKEVNELE